jgi:hypothetical protein
LLAAGIAFLTLWADEPEPEPQETTPIVTTPTMDLIHEMLDDVEKVLFSPAGNTTFTIYRDPDDMSIELDADVAVFPGESSMLRSVFTTATALINLTIVIEEADDEQLTTFGFDAPVLSWRVYRTDGTSVGFVVGMQQVAGQGRYIREENSRQVLLINQRQSDLLLQTLEDLYDLTFFPPEIFIGVEYIMDVFDNIILETDSEVIELRRRPDEEFFELGLGTSRYQMIQPLISESNDHIIQTVILENAIEIIPESVEAKLPTDLSLYGLDSPNRLTLQAGDWVGTLLIGSYDAERGGRYLMIEGYDAVLFDTSGEYAFLNIGMTQLRSRLIWLHNIAEIASLEFELEGVTRVLEFEHDHENQSLQGWLDGEFISEVNARRLYMAALSITQTDETNAPIPNVPPAYRITKYFLEGGTETLELYQLNDSQFLIVHEGESTGFFITRMTLQRGFLSRFEILDRGEDIPAT